MLEGKEISSDEMVEYLEGIVKDYPVVSIEDGLSEEDWKGWGLLTKRLGHRVQLVGDDLFVTNVAKLSRGIIEEVGNSILVKVNQIGRLPKRSRPSRWPRGPGTAVISHRSGERGRDYRRH